MSNSIKRFLVLFFFGALSLAAFASYWTGGVSFYTYHSLSGLTAIKYQIAQTLMDGSFPLWNPFMLAGAPFHSGIGVLDPFLAGFLFEDPIWGMLSSSYLALFVGGIGMYLYLHKTWELSIPASILGGGLYLLNPFFAATSHELPFMAPAVYLPLAMMFYTRGKTKQSLFNYLMSGALLGFSFLSGNLESYFFILLFFCTFHFLLRCSEENFFSFAGFKEIKSLAGVVLFSFLFVSIDLIPSVEMIANSGRSANSILFQNTAHFLLMGIASLLIFSLHQKVDTKFKTAWVLVALALCLLFFIEVNFAKHWVGIRPHLLFPDLSKIMTLGTDSFSWVHQALGGSQAALKSILLPRFVFYIQPPIYFFTFTTVFFFLVALLKLRSAKIKMLAWFSVGIILFPYTLVPNLSHRLLGLDAIAFPRLMFAFFFLFVVVFSYGFHHLFEEKKINVFEGLEKWGSKFFIALGALVLFHSVFSSSIPFSGDQVAEQVRSFSELGDQGAGWIESSIAYFCLKQKLLSFFYHANIGVFMMGLLMGAGLVVLGLLIRNSGERLKWVLILLLLAHASFSWNLYTFQTKDIQSLNGESPELGFLRDFPTESRVAIARDPDISVLNFYESKRILELGTNMPMFWGVKTIEGAALNLSPKLFNEFWQFEPLNSYTPTVINQIPSKLYDLMSMKYLMSDREQNSEQLNLVTKGKRFYIYENLIAVPRFYHADKTRQIESWDAFSGEVGGLTGWDHKKETLVVDALDEYDKVSIVTGGLKRIEILKDSANSLSLKSISNRAEFLVVTDAFHPNWKVKVNGKRTRVVRANFYFKGVLLPPGINTIEFTYDPLSFKIGFLLSFFAILLLIWARLKKEKVAA